MAALADTFWRGKRIFITGHSGFKGVWLSLWLQSLGAEVFGYSTSASSKEGKFAVPMRTFRGDICDADKLHPALIASRPDVVIHMAAQPFIRKALQDPIGTYRTNVIGTATLLERVQRCDSVGAVIVVTTDKCYENQEWDWAYREVDRLGGSDPYSSSKACMELVVRSFRDSFFTGDGAGGRRVGIATARAGNMLGGGDWGKDRLVPDMIRSFAAGTPVVLRNPTAKRPWQFVLDTLRGYLLLAESLYEDPARYEGAWNFGPGASEVRTVEWIVEKLATAWGAEAKWNIQPSPHPQEVPMLRLDCSKAAKELSWTPVLELADALQMTVDWYRDLYAGKNIAETYAAQIAAYSARSNAKWELLSPAVRSA
jgi:CDP-glucose 4,6-dehydratase